MKTKQTKKRVSYRLSNDVMKMMANLKNQTGKTATQIVEESIMINHVLYYQAAKNEKS